MIVIGSNTSDNGQSCFTEDVSHFLELRQNRQLALLKRSAKKSVDGTNNLFGWTDEPGNKPKVPGFVK